jgi:hypothetical protein
MLQNSLKPHELAMQSGLPTALNIPVVLSRVDPKKKYFAEIVDWLDTGLGDQS